MHHIHKSHLSSSKYLHLINIQLNWLSILIIHYPYIIQLQFTYQIDIMSQKYIFFLLCKYLVRVSQSNTSYNRTLTEKDSQVLDLNHHDLQHWPGDVLNVVFHLHLNQPIKNLLLSVHVTIKQIGNSLFEENKWWEFLKFKKVV